MGYLLHQNPYTVQTNNFPKEVFLKNEVGPQVKQPNQLKTMITLQNPGHSQNHTFSEGLGLEIYILKSIPKSPLLEGISLSQRSRSKDLVSIDFFLPFIRQMAFLGVERGEKILLQNKTEVMQ